jgi:hypothetical protein
VELIHVPRSRNVRSVPGTRKQSCPHSVEILFKYRTRFLFLNPSIRKLVTKGSLAKHDPTFISDGPLACCTSLGLAVPDAMFFFGWLIEYIGLFLNK